MEHGARDDVIQLWCDVGMMLLECESENVWKQYVLSKGPDVIGSGFFWL